MKSIVILLIVRFEPTTPETLRAVGLAAAVCMPLVRGAGS